MTRNQFIAIQAGNFGMLPQGHDAPMCVQLAIILANELEAQGCAPWQDAPPVERLAGSNEPLTFAMNERDTPPTRREITAADVQPGAIFTDEDGEKREVLDLFGMHEVRYKKESTQLFYINEIDAFVCARNDNNATVTPPTA